MRLGSAPSLHVCDPRVVVERVGGFAGYPSFATAAFFGFGAYATGVLMNDGLSMWLSVVIAAVAALVLAAHARRRPAAAARPLLRDRKLSLAEVLRELVNNATDLTGGGMGLNIPLVSGSSVLGDAMFFFYAMLGLLLATR